VVNFAQTHPDNSPQIPGLLIRLGGTMANPTNEKRKQYAHYAAHCMYLVTAATDPDARTISREMAAEWLKLADAILHPMGSTECNPASSSIIPAG
jgi:hypothetical protein